MHFPRIDARRRRIAALAGLGVVALLLVAVLLLLSFGWGLLKHPIERRISASLERPVTIGAIRRLDGLSLHPLLSIEDVRIGQPAWVAGVAQGDMARIRAAQVRIALLPLLIGQARPELLRIEGLRLALVRGADGLGNWETPAPPHDSDGAPPRLGQIVVPDGLVSLDDRKRDRHLIAHLTIDAAGLRMAGTGTIAGTPARVSFSGPALMPGRQWPFRVALTSGVVSATMAGRMTVPLDLAHFTAAVTSRGRDLRDLDRLIDAGMPATQPYRLAATVRHDARAWFITGLQGMIGRSDVAGDIAVRKPGGRTFIDADLRSNGFDFDDLATDKGLAISAARARVTGKRFFPETPIDLARLRAIDGRLKVAIGRVLSKRPTLVRSGRGMLTLDHGVLSVAPLTVTLLHGRVVGTAVVDHKSGAPLLTLDLRLQASRLEGMLTGPATATGPLDGRFQLRGHGATLRAAIADADGTMALVTRNGQIGRRIALFLGADVGNGIFAGGGATVPLTCVIGGFAVRDGIARPAPLVFDSPVGRADGSGTLNLRDERFALDLMGQPKGRTLLRLNAPILVSGTIESTIVNPPPQTKTVGGILKMIGGAIGGTPQPVGRDVDCAGLAAKALR